ncbi:MAG: glutaminyl-peptide cyclotransferase [Kibdelosporangium sp.]
MKVLLAVGMCLFLVACSSTGSSDGASGGSPGSAPPKLRAEVLAVLPHDPQAFTQGLEMSGDVLYEGTGLEGQSSLRSVDPSTAQVAKKVDLPADFFGEGMTVAGSKIWQITWKNGVAIQRDKDSLAEVKRVEYEGEGWGLCLAGQRLVMSDGTDKLTFRDPESFAPVGEVRVSTEGAPVTELNELECTPQGVYANVWKTDTVVRIDPSSGRVTATVDLAGLLNADERANADVLNGIAAVPGTDEFLVTGKLWPKMFRVRFVTAG